MQKCILPTPIYPNIPPDFFESNILRKITDDFKKYIGLDYYRKCSYYYHIHNVFIFIIGFILLFNTNIVHLSILLIIISLDAVSVVILHECPLTAMEKKYLGYTSCEERNEILKNMGIMYNCDHNYEKQVELLINIWLLISGKILMIILLHMSNIKLRNSSNIYISNI
jgi:hypothetical protein